MPSLDLKGKKVAVLGLGLTGCAVVRRLLMEGGHVIAADEKPLEQLDKKDDVMELQAAGVQVRLGKDAFDGLDGCDLAVISPGISVRAASIQRLIASGVEVIGEIELAFRLCQAPIIAVTGTNGKTTTASLIHHILQTAGKESVLVGNIGEPFISRVDEIDAGQIVVLEVSSFQLSTCKTFKPKIGVLLNIAPDHLDWHLSFEEYVDSKAKLFENQSGEDWTVLNADEFTVSQLAGRVKARIFWFGFSLSESCPYCTFWTGFEGNQLIGCIEGERFSICPLSDFRLAGRHNLSNLMAAAGASLLMGVSAESIRKGVRTFEGVEHRIEPVAQVNGIIFINDSAATTPHACCAALMAVPPPIILIAGGRAKGVEFSSLKEAMQGRVKALVAIGETAQILAAIARQAGVNQIVFAGSMPDAVEAASQLAKEGETVLLSPACASFDMFKNYLHRGEEFKAAVRELTVKRDS